MKLTKTQIYLVICFVFGVITAMQGVNAHAYLAAYLVISALGNK